MLNDVKLPILNESPRRPNGAAANDGLLRLLLEEQQTLTPLNGKSSSLTAVEEFSQYHDQHNAETRDTDQIGTCPAAGGTKPAQARYYERLLPASPPKLGEQYAFEVDLDCCSGCKACVTACHSLNGLDEQETWRDVGLLIGGTSFNPVMQHVTTACHHCLEPACMIACPVDAYEKNPETGIVKHLDDQCFGCQYCTLACPYDVPKYHSGKGIVRKCDMCADRLEVGEAPACVQACPHEAIAIKVVTVSDVRENAEADPFLPAAPEPYLTFPTTTYKTKRVFPRNLLPADYYSVNPQHPHWPLILMLVLTQLSVGAFAVSLALESFLSPSLLSIIRPIQAMLALGLALVALGASTLHLGRPQFAFRAIIGLRHSWLSREIIAFGLFAGAASTYAAATWSGLFATEFLRTLGWIVVGTGLTGLFCSAMIYVFTKRDFWSFGQTMSKFLLTASTLGIATTWLSVLLPAVLGDRSTSDQLLAQLHRPLAQALLASMAAKLMFELVLFRHLAGHRNSPLKRSALLLIGPLSSSLLSRMAAGLLGGIAMPLFFLMRGDDVARADIRAALMVGMLFLGCLVGELLERYQFFAAVSAPRMPGGPRR